MKLSVGFVFLMCVVGVYLVDLDAIDVDEVLGNPRLLNNMINCICRDKKCTPEGKAIKERIATSISTSCAECSDKQKTSIRKAGRFVQQNRPDDWNCITNKYDPEGKYKESYTKFFASN
ncbi:ejaculatory bulb-specific protein 3-like [Chrysoperla carnea]|uniref:ejaculatory bulb-specific protein 3-like n=1 Tax=Chrysoperla carnea TaxID=189513 RepID=UPI001D06C0DE|nr:ejaculatory bulb-specific protein 3-like [Chrysoperla carnea]